MEVVEGHKVTFQETREQTKVHLDPTRLYKWKVSSRWADFRWSVFSFFFRCSPRQRTGTRARWPQGWSCSGACSQKSPGSSSPPGKSENNCNGFPARRKITKQNHRNTAFTSLLHTFAKGKSIMYDQTIQNYYCHQFHLNVSSHSKYVDQYWWGCCNPICKA